MFLTQTFSTKRRLLGDLLDLVRSGLLGLVRVVGTRVDLQLLEDLAAELVLRQHSPHGLLDGLAGVLLEDLTDRSGRQTTRVAGVAVGPLCDLLVAGQRDLLRVGDDDEVTRGSGGGGERLLPAPQGGGGAGT